MDCVSSPRTCQCRCYTGCQSPKVSAGIGSSCGTNIERDKRNGIRRGKSLKRYYFGMYLSQNRFICTIQFDAHTPIHHYYIQSKCQNCCKIRYYCIK